MTHCDQDQFQICHIQVSPRVFLLSPISSSSSTFLADFSLQFGGRSTQAFFITIPTGWYPPPSSPVASNHSSGRWTEETTMRRWKEKTRNEERTGSSRRQDPSLTTLRGGGLMSPNWLIFYGTTLSLWTFRRRGSRKSEIHMVRWQGNESLSQSVLLVRRTVSGHVRGSSRRRRWR